MRTKNAVFCALLPCPVAATGEEWILAVTDYGTDICRGVAKGKVSAFQFHPEKSGGGGLTILAIVFPTWRQIRAGRTSSVSAKPESNVRPDCQKDNRLS